METNFACLAAVVDIEYPMWLCTVVGRRDCGFTHQMRDAGKHFDKGRAITDDYERLAVDIYHVFAEHGAKGYLACATELFANILDV